MIESDVILCIREAGILPAHIKKAVIESDNGVHPMAEVFMLVGKVDEFNMGTSTRTLSSRTGKWVQQQTIGYDVRIAFQGLKNKKVDDDVEEFKMLLDTPFVRQVFMDAGYTYTVDPKTISLPIQLNTDMYVRHTFKVRFKTSRMITYAQPTLDSVKVGGVLKDRNDYIVSEIEMDIP